MPFLFLTAALLHGSACAPASNQGIKTEKDTPSFPVVGETYDLENAEVKGIVRPQGEDEFIVCTSAAAVEEYAKAERAGDEKKLNEMLMVDKYDVDPIRGRKCCIAISRYSQATVIEKGTSAIKAHFDAWPFMPMWTDSRSFREMAMEGMRNRRR